MAKAVIKGKGKAKVPTRLSIKHASGKKITAFGKFGGTVAKKLATQVFESKQSASSTPPNWPKDWVADARWCGWLPPDWTPAIKKTAGGILIPGCVGPAPDHKPFFHKVSLEKYLGRDLGLDERGEKPPEITCGTFDPNMFIQRLGVSAGAGYINDRLEKLHGLSVAEAMEVTYFHGTEGGGKTKRYACTDLKYDITCKRLVLVADRPSQSSKPTIVPSTPRAPGTPRAPRTSTPATPARRPASSAPATPARATPARQRACAPTTPGLLPLAAAPATPAAKRTSAAPSTPAARRTNAAPSTPAKQPRRTAAASGSSSSGISSPGQVFRACYAPLRTRAAKGFEDQKAILAIQGVGFTLGLDPVMLKSVPEILGKEPSQRGDFGAFVLRQIEIALGKA